jgi:glycosyltransferase involved in cell wall biosynthesis
MHRDKLYTGQYSEHMVSILMPVYNAAKFLDVTIQSIVDQSYKNWQLIAVDDFSDDNSLSILKKWSERDARILCFSNQEKGIIHAMRCAYSKSDGEYISRMDADDIMHSDKISLLKNTLSQQGKGYVAIGLVEYFSDAGLGEGYKKYEQWLNALSLEESNYTDIYKECVIPSPCWLVHRHDLDKAGAFNSNLYPEDYDLCFRFRNCGLMLTTVPQIVHYWRDHQNRSSRNDPNYADNSFLNLKMFHFTRTDYNPDKSLVLWGAGRKAKRIAHLLLEENIRFDWICENSKKIGHAIYGVLLEDAAEYVFKANSQLLLSVAQRNAKSGIFDRIDAVLSQEEFELFELA